MNTIERFTATDELRKIQDPNYFTQTETGDLILTYFHPSAEDEYLEIRLVGERVTLNYLKQDIVESTETISYTGGWMNYLVISVKDYLQIEE